MDILDCTSDLEIECVLLGVILDHFKSDAFKHRFIINCLMGYTEISHACFMRTIECLDLKSVDIASRGEL